MNKEIIPSPLKDYLIRFLLGDVPHADDYVSEVAYLDAGEDDPNAKVIIRHSGFFDKQTYGTSDSVPDLPLKNIESTPLLFGKPIVMRDGNRLIVEADVIASTFFMVTRYEETIKRKLRDEHGRFPGKESLPYIAGFLRRPIVDEYGQLLRKWLRVVGLPIGDPPKGFNQIYLTSDIDMPYLYTSVRKALKSVLRPQDIKSAFLSVRKGIRHDPAFTFPWFVEQAGRLKPLNPRSIYFFRARSMSPKDAPAYDIKSAELRFLFHYCEANNIEIGLHASYDIGTNPQLISFERRELGHACRQDVFINRNHFLRCIRPEDHLYQESGGVKEDFTMGYADVVGFRLGTSRAVRWISTNDLIPHKLILHPLTVMDCTLDRYMKLSYEEALEVVREMMVQTATHRGDLNLLWHNHYILSMFSKWQKKLYKQVIDDLCECIDDLCQ